MNAKKEKQESKNKIILSAIISFVGVSVLVIFILISDVLEDLQTGLKVGLSIFSVIVFIICIIMAIVLDREAGSFECQKCKNRFTPTMKAYIMGVHTLKKRRLKCPECGKTSYCKHVLNK